ncbi:unnamed protein product [Gongylonema pulchrum]|uniref:YTH domain-containing protein n=1 Tax=Gongylonema pulchrum TaxID=637853 RepID=A0A183DWX9_9BILA|nr:unnamed protein product [Gongylonema pulchrum]
MDSVTKGMGSGVPCSDYPYMLQGQQSSLIYPGNVGTAPFGTTQTGYGYGSFTAVYNNGGTSNLPPVSDPPTLTLNGNIGVYFINYEYCAVVLQYPYMLQGQQSSLIYPGNVGTAPFGTTQTGYGYGSFTAVYNNGGTSNLPPVSDPPTLTLNGNIGGNRTPPASTLFSSSPPGAFHFSVGYPTPPTINQLTSNLSNLAVGPPQPPSTAPRRDSFSSNSTASFGVQSVQPQHQYPFVFFSQAQTAGSLGSSPNFFGTAFPPGYNAPSMFPGSSSSTHLQAPPAPRSLYNVPQQNAIAQVPFNAPSHNTRRTHAATGSGRLGQGSYVIHMLTNNIRDIISSTEGIN